MELPRLGQQCTEPTCKQLDFLPMKCDACSQIFCRDHIMYATHDCSESYKKNNQVPVCPLCRLPCPTTKGESPDIVVSKHIESDCLSDPAKNRRKVYTNRCSRKGCKKKELVPVVCDSCRLNFCFHHRHQQDHNCKGFQGSGRAISSAGAAAILRAQKKTQAPSLPAPSSSGAENSSKCFYDRQPEAVADLTSFQASMNEDEAMARALQISMKASIGQDEPPLLDRVASQEPEDFLLAQAIALSLQDMLLSSTQQPQQTLKV
ncbi:unnamed protein product [Candidula unifasciata]|uniref:AN1-type domain-containing protein n=1 Tax=Candidula unifasciata TaxID=100452 RepID=A0A8S3Z6Z9_9EUPU|nr:unnamed protein product [Candidula unifasciata]